MTCIKTGAVVHMLSHDLVFSADLFKVGNARVIRANAPLVRGKNCWDPTEALMRVTHTLGNAIASEEFWRDDLGVFVVPEDRLVEVAR